MAGNTDDLELPSHNEVISLANRLLSDFNINTRVSHIEDISAALFVVLYEGLFSQKLPGIIRQPLSREDEIHNCQIVIDKLSTDIIRDDLSHINGEDVVSGVIEKIFNLLDIFSYLFEYVSNRIDSDVPTDNDESRSDVADLSGLASRSFDSGRGARGAGSPLAGYRTNGSRTIPKNLVNGHRKVNLNTNENRAVISHKEFDEMAYENKARTSKLSSQRAPSPIRPDDSHSLLGHKTIDSEFSIDNLEKKAPSSMDGKPSPPDSPKVAWSEKSESKPSDKVEEESGGVGAAVAATQLATNCESEKDTRPAAVSHVLLQRQQEILLQYLLSKYQPTDPAKNSEPSRKEFSASLPAPKKQQNYELSERLASTVGPIAQTPTTTPERHNSQSADGKACSTSLDDLRHLVEKTAAMTRFALDSSPVRSKTMQELDLEETNPDRARPRIPGEGVRLAKELNSIGFNSRHHTTQAATRGGKKVAFAPTSLRSEYEYERSPLSALSSNNVGYHSDYSSDKDSDYLEEDLKFRNHINNKQLRYGEEVVESTKPQKKPRGGSKEKSSSLVSHLAKNRQPELGAAHMTLKTQDRALTRKQNILKKMYEEDLAEFTEEVDHMLEKEAKKSEETGELFKKKCKTSAPAKKPVKKTRGSAVNSTYKKPRNGNSQTNKAQPEEKDSKSVTPTPWHLESEEDLLPLLLEEFPHLHLTQHTWHELWRRGLNQIQALTNAYAGAQLKKSREQSQLEEAAERHEMLGNLMKKQLDHGKRLREIKEQKQLQAHMRNKAHEKKIQSARARKYYNEYQVRARGKQLKRRTKEEMVFRDLFKDALDIQKERIKDIRQYATDQRKRQESRRQNEIDSMENFYRDQFDMLSDRLKKERHDTEVRDTAQQKMLGQMKRELRKKMESEIKSYQDNLLKDEDDAHWRRVDADRVKQQLHLARYSAKI